MNKPFVSIIIPVYNSEKYLKRCLDSVINQSFINFEAIVINDGSTDQSLDIIKDFEKKDKRIKVIDKQNEGVSKTRNRGLKEATGDYICFIDSDDYVERNYLEELTNSITDDNELAVCWFYHSFPDEPNKKGKDYFRGKTIIDRKEYLKEMSKYIYSVYFGSLWNKIYNSKILKNNNMVFDETIDLAEDLIFNLKYLQYIDSITIKEKHLYYYSQDNEESLTKVGDATYKWEMAKKRFTYCIEQYKIMEMFNDCQEDIYTAVAVELIAPTYDIVKENYKGYNTAKEKLKVLYDNDFAKNAIKYNKKKNMVHKIAKLSINLNNYGLFVFLMRRWIRIQRYENK